jgi:cardiolipin synthase
MSRCLVFLRALACCACLGLVGGASCAKKSEKTSTEYRLKAAIPEAGPGFDLALSQTLDVTMRAGNEVAFVNDARVFDAIVNEVSHATSSIHVVSYIWKKGEASDRIVNAVTQRARAGVACKIVVDAFGSSTFEGDGVGKALRDAGCDVRGFRPPATSDIARNHRKLVIVDGKVGIAGGFGIRDNWLKEVDGEPRWRDTNLRVAGPVVGDMQHAFAENWLESGGPLLPPEAFPTIEGRGSVRAAFVASTASPVVTRAERLVQLVIASAKKRVWIENAYFVPSVPICEMLATKAQTGLDVRVLAPGKQSDSKPSFLMQRNEYGDLMEKHVRVFEYEPRLMHAKTILVDDRLAVVGSVNLEPLSLGSLEESVLVLDDAEAAKALEAQFLEDSLSAKELSKGR